MFVMKSRFIFLIIFIGFVESDQNIVSVRVKNGLIKGRIEPSIDGKTLNVFKGIPYAQPPVDDLRFKRPLPVREWTEPIEANQFSKACIQNKLFLEMLGSSLDISEDCLYLNIWSPNNNEDNEMLKPVMFWIHGGAFVMGSAAEKLYNGQVLAAKGDVVVVSVNYRLNTLGFLYSGTDDAPGNAGLWDQALALEWVKDNIKYFGGDPDRITIFGESAGAWSVSLHVLSPVSRNLFKNAIMNSGAYINNFIRDAPEDHIKKWRKGAELIGCSDDQNNDNKLTEKIMECLKKVDPLKLMSIVYLPQMAENVFKIFNYVVVDGKFLPQKPIEMLRSQDFDKNINLMFSTNEDEGSFLLPYSGDMVKYHPLTPQNLSLSEASNELIRLSEDLGTGKAVNGKQVAKLYFSGLSGNDLDLLRRTIGIAIGDYIMTCPTTTFAKEFFKNSGFKSNVYQLFFNSKTETEMPICSKWMGVCHGNDITFTFGLPFLTTGDNQKEQQISAQFIQFITDFAKNDVPTPQNGSEWPKYFAIDDNIVAPYYEITSEPKLHTNFGIGFKIDECEHLWKKYIT